MSFVSVRLCDAHVASVRCQVLESLLNAMPGSIPNWMDVPEKESLIRATN